MCDSLFLWIFEYISVKPLKSCKSLDFFHIFSDLTSVYCEIHEILIICLVSSSDLCVQVSGCWLQEKRGRDHCFVFCICFWNNWYSSAYFIHVTLCIWFEIGIQFLDLFLWSGFPIWILHLNPQYICINPWISWIFLRISSLNIVKSSDLLDLFFHSLVFCNNIRGIFDFANLKYLKW